MTVQEPEWEDYAAKVHEWIQEAYGRIYNSQEEMTLGQSKVGLAASYCLLAAHDYMEIAFFAFHKKLYHPGMACLRPVAEMAICFLWCTLSVEDYIEKLGRWMKQSLDKAKKRYDQLELWVLSDSDRESFGSKKQEWERNYGQFFADMKDLPSVLNMLEEIDQRHAEGFSVKGLYPMLYATLCGSAHGRLEPDRYFTPGGSAINRRRHAPMPSDAPWASLTVIVWLVVGIYKFFGWEYSKLLNEYRQLSGQSGDTIPNSIP